MKACCCLSNLTEAVVVVIAVTVTLMGFVPPCSCIWGCTPMGWQPYYGCYVWHFEEAKNFTARVSGIVINLSSQPVQKELELANYGMEVLVDHKLDFGKIRSGLNDALKTNRSFEFHRLSAETRNVTCPGATAMIFYEESAECTYWPPRKTGEVEKPLRGAVRVYAHQERNISLADPCEDFYIDITKETYPDDTLNYRSKLLRNRQNTTRLVPFTFYEGVGTEDAPPHLDQDKLDFSGDKLLFLEWLNARLWQWNETSPSPTTELDWSQYIVSGLGRAKRDYVVALPPDRDLNLYQARARCGGTEIYGWVFPVFTGPRAWPCALPDTCWTPAQCESPQFKPVCVMKENHVPGLPVRPEVTLKGANCTESFNNIGWVKDMDRLTLEHGIAGTFSETPGFRKLFVDKLNQIGVHETGFNWTSLTFNKIGWGTYGGPQASEIKIPSRPSGTRDTAALQLIGTCGTTKLYTGVLAFVHTTGEDNKCISVSMASIKTEFSCQSVEKWLHHYQTENEHSLRGMGKIISQERRR